MPWWKRKPDPWSARERELKDRIATLQREIRQLEELLRAGDTPGPGTGSMPATSAAESFVPGRPSTGAFRRPTVAATELEDVRTARPRLELPSAPPHDLYNEFGVRRYDLPAVWRRLRDKFRGPVPPNPELVQLLAAGGAPELRSLRVERRIARNRFLALVTGLILILLGIFWALLRSP
jgi:hypothetical protein